MSDWDWSDEESVLIQRVEAIAVYTNTAGNIVIRQQDSMGGDDQIVIIPRMHAQVVVDAIRKEMQES